MGPSLLYAWMCHVLLVPVLSSRYFSNHTLPRFPAVLGQVSFPSPCFGHFCSRGDIPEILRGVQIVQRCEWR
ncbi:hypothetical protein J3F83DRAFT_726083 [Trichoderma novae-zelandiae]